GVRGAPADAARVPARGSPGCGPARARVDGRLLAPGRALRAEQDPPLPRSLRRPGEPRRGAGLAVRSGSTPRRELATAVQPAAVRGDAAARKFQMSGTWVVRSGQVFIPLQFAAAGMGAMGTIIPASMGNLTGAYGLPNGPIPGTGGVMATGSAPIS